MLAFFPSRYMAAVSDGLLLFVMSVLPAMLPFFFFSRLLTSLDVASSLADYTKKPLQKLFGAPDIGGYIFVMSMLSGYPIGAKLVADCCENGIVSKEEAKRLLAFTSTSGPLFVLGTVGSNMLGNYKAGLVILFTHYLGAVINGIIFRSKTPAPSAKAFTLTKYDNILSDAINGSIASVLAVGGYIAIFNMLIVLFKDIKLIGFVSETLSGLGIPYLLCEGMVTGVIEITRGSYLLAASGESLKAIVPLLSAIISFGGLSVTVQSLSFLSGCGIKARYYFVTKLSQCVVTFALATVVSLLVF
jgi:sporulation integral membrane protein YlbJ